MSLATTLKQLRMKKGQSLQQLADSVGCSKAHIWELEIGKSTNPSMELLQKLANHFEVSIARFNQEQPEPENESMMVMFRDFSALGERDQETIKAVMKTLKKLSKNKEDSDAS
jgi:transcriptional regulator with XRE-family HTH domain